MESKVTEHQKAALDVLLEKVYQDSGHDFRDYRRGTVARRLERRMLATGVTSYVDYMYFLDSHPEEYNRFVSYLTIKVSRFFRSRYTFQQMSAMILPELLSNKIKQRDFGLKFWSAGCAHGEEPYSIAIMMADFLGENRADFNINIYASDIDYLDMKRLRPGVFAAAEVEDLPRSILDRYFLSYGEEYEVIPDIRHMVHFFHLDLAAADGQALPSMDCIFCCNVLIYFQRQLQERVLNRLYHSLVVPGYLVLGEVETPTTALLQKMECLDSKAKIYKKVSAGGS